MKNQFHQLYSTKLGTLRSDDGDGNGNAIKAIGLITKTTILHVHHVHQKNLQSHLAYCTTLHPAYDEIFGTFYTLVIYINNDLKNDYLSHASSTMPLSGVVKRIFAALKAKHTKSAGFRRNVSTTPIFPLDPRFTD